MSELIRPDNAIGYLRKLDATNVSTVISRRSAFLQVHNVTYSRQIVSNNDKRLYTFERRNQRLSQTDVISFYQKNR